MPHFFVDPADITENTVTIRGEEAKHISYSLRMAVSEKISIADGTGRHLVCQLCAMDGQSVKASILSCEPSRSEMPVKVHLYQGYPKSDKMEFIIQKAVELGVYSITPFESSRCIKRPKADRAEHIAERQNRIALEAAKQCQRDILPKVALPLCFSAMLKEACSYPLALFCYEGEGTLPIGRILSAHPDIRELAVIVGCEGGFSPEEADAAKAAGACLTGLGPRILRCETAPLYALSSISYQFELLSDPS